MEQLFLYVLDLFAAFKFWRQAGIRRSVVRRVLRDLSNLYLTPQKAGVLTLSDVSSVVTIVTTTHRMSIAVNSTNGPSTVYWVNREALAVAVNDGGLFDELPIEAPANEFVLDLVKCFARNGIPLKRNNDGVAYREMPGEEKYARK